ncbi:MAG: single-stranded DNA-binding protein [Deltaproteobacteria bacterium]|nr:single-stranded DNA-binding protein [Deltaproteobacteria bacterium]
MQGINQVLLLGHLGNSPELRHTNGGKACCRLRLATNRSARREDEWVQETDWHDIVLWDDLAERASRTLSKGTLCLVEGRLVPRSWDDGEGRRHRVVEVAARRFSAIAGSRPASYPQVDREVRSRAVLPDPLPPEVEQEGPDDER